MICKSCGTIHPGEGSVCPLCHDRLQQETPVLQRLRQHFAGKYEFRRLLGIGGYGEVYLARDRMLERDVAFKILLSTYSQDPQMKERFIREARLYARMEHPHLIPIYDTGVLDNDVFLVMKFIDGETLKSYITREKRITNHWAMQFVVMIGSALEYIHENGIVHRDIKPANILMEKRTGNLFLADFGIARFESSQTLTNTGMIIGTPYYISPEQIKGKKIDRRSDIYALGSTLYELLCGDPPFQGHSPLDIMYQHVNEEPIPLADRCPDIQPLWLKIVERCLKKDPNLRFQNVREITALLHPGQVTTVLQGPVLPKPPSKKRRRWLVPASLFGMAAAGLLFVPGWLRHKEKPPVTVETKDAVQSVGPKQDGSPPANGTEFPDNAKLLPDVQGQMGKTGTKKEPPEAVKKELSITPEKKTARPAAIPPITNMTGVVAFSSFPPTLPADVYFNGKKIGTTEQAFEQSFPQGKYTFVFVVPDYQSVEVEVEVKAGVLTSAHHKFTPFRQFTVNATPFGTLSIDGQEIGETPCYPKIPHGRHQLKISRPGYRTEERTIVVDKDISTIVSFKLTKEE